MAVITYGGGVTSITGSIGGTTFTQAAGTKVVKAKATVTKPKTALQLQHQAAFSYLSKTYSKSLTPGQQVAWTAATQGFPVTSKAGVTHFLKPLALFEKLNYYLYITGNTINLNPPNSWGTGALASISCTAISGGGGSITLTNTVTDPLGSDVVMWELTPAISPGIKSFASQLQFMPGTFPVNASATVTTDWVNRYGSLPGSAGYTLGFKATVLNLDSGVVSSALSGKVTWA